MKKIVLCFFILFIPLSIIKADYVLPYPSAMPGNKLYTLQKIVDKVKEYWSFGSIAKGRYYRSIADTSLVEAKTLYEYKQYLLATEALHHSDRQFEKVPRYLMDAYGEGKDISQELQTFIESAQKHEEVLYTIKSMLPDSFTWTPEKKESTELQIGNDIQNSIQIRQKSVVNMQKFLFCLLSISADIPQTKKAEGCKEGYQSFTIPSQESGQKDYLPTFFQQDVFPQLNSEDAHQ